MNNSHMLFFLTLVSAASSGQSIGQESCPEGVCAGNQLLDDTSLLQVNKQASLVHAKNVKEIDDTEDDEKEEAHRDEGELGKTKSEEADSNDDGGLDEVEPKDLDDKASRYILGTTNTNVCPVGSKTLFTTSSCRTAAESLGLKGASATVDSSRPSGCFVTTYKDKGTMQKWATLNEFGGSPNIEDTPICDTQACTCSGHTRNGKNGPECNSFYKGKSHCYTKPGVCPDGVASSTEKGQDWSFKACEAADYVVGSLNTNRCPWNTEKISTESACRKAAAAFGRTLGPNEDYEFRPGGCYWDHSTVYFNNNSFCLQDESSACARSWLKLLCQKAYSVLVDRCSVRQPTCKAIFAKAADSLVECTEAASAGAAMCEGPGDPGEGDVCAAEFVGSILVACKKAVNAGASFGADQCIKAGKC